MSITSWRSERIARCERLRDLRTVPAFSVSGGWLRVIRQGGLRGTGDHTRRACDPACRAARRADAAGGAARVRAASTSARTAPRDDDRAPWRSRTGGGPRDSTRRRNSGGMTTTSRCRKCAGPRRAAVTQRRIGCSPTGSRVRGRRRRLSAKVLQSAAREGTSPGDGSGFRPTATSARSATPSIASTDGPTCKSDLILHYESPGPDHDPDPRSRIPIRKAAVYSPRTRSYALGRHQSISGTGHDVARLAMHAVEG